MRALLHRLKEKFVRWLFSDVELHVGQHSTIIKPDSIVFESLTADPSTPTAGQIWYRSDLSHFRYSDGATVYSILTLDDRCSGHDATVYSTYDSGYNYDVDASVCTTYNSGVDNPYNSTYNYDEDATVYSGNNSGDDSAYDSGVDNPYNSTYNYDEDATVYSGNNSLENTSNYESVYTSANSGVYTSEDSTVNSSECSTVDSTDYGTDFTTNLVDNPLGCTSYNSAEYTGVNNDYCISV